MSTTLLPFAPRADRIIRLPEGPRRALWLPGEPIPGKPFIDAKGNVVCVRPLSLGDELQQHLAEAQGRAIAKRLGIPFVHGEAAGAWTFVNGARTNLLNGTFDLDSDSFKMALFLSSSNLAVGSTTYAGVTNEVANAVGYTTGGIAVTLTLAGTTTVTVDISVDPVWTAAGGSITARFAAIYEVSGNVLCFALLDSTPADVTATDGNTLTVAASASGVFTLA